MRVEQIHCSRISRTEAKRDETYLDMDIELDRIVLVDMTVLVDMLISMLALPLIMLIPDARSSIALETAEDGTAEALSIISVADAIALSEMRLPSAGFIVATVEPIQNISIDSDDFVKSHTDVVANSSSLLLVAIRNRSV